ncbi:uncharacterized protein EDB91DRAFT_1238466 [Suillus paluster]|uniref:uncharacterized protein n=1 Tax=Suillus paluster TaxID=48578 RepID=UPI001B871279|nr:uncharacterized protein EDB91DRAFT_1238466 [Suillus paluster]KAG1734062.1 hypothetical protein EDB91DRAFT_1238466 [Suillus paluster]
MSDSGYSYGDDGGTVGLENDLPGSIEEPLGSQASEKPYIEHFRDAAKVYRCGQTFLDRFNMDPYAVHRKDNLYYPFMSRQDWELGSVLLCSSLSMAAMDEFLGLKLVKALPLSFRTTKELHGRSELLPSVPKWQYHIISTTHPTKKPLHLYWRDPLDCIESLFSHPLFANKIDLTPQRVYDTVECTARIYSKWVTGDTAWSMQSQLPDGATLLGIILSSDKTNITNMTGGRVAHPLLISLANIKMATRNKASSHAFLLTALLPIAEFLHPVKRMQSVLEARLVHQCLDIVLEPLKQATRIGQMMSDPLGNLRYSKTTLSQLSSINCDPLDVEGYFNACAAFRLSGVAQPFWRNRPLADPYLFLTPESLHHWHRECYDHNVKWCLAAVGEQELDFRFSILQPLMTFRRFNGGISNLKQVTGRAQCDMQRYIVALIADAAPHGVVIAICALMDFRYLSQATTINQEHFGSLLQWSADTTEHAHITLIKDPADSTNNINYDAQICRFLDRQEKCRNFQITTSIIAQSESESQLEASASSSRMMDDDSEHHDSDEGPLAYIDEAHLQTVSDDLWGPKRVVTNFFRKAEQVSLDIQGARPLRTFVVGATAIHLNFDPSIRHIPVDVIAEKLSLPDLQGALADYIQREGTTAQKFHLLGGQRRAPSDAPLPFDDLMVWFKVHVQQASYHTPSIIPPALTVNASPLSATWKHGHYDAAIFVVDDTRHEQWPTSGLKGHAVVEVHLIMQPLPPRGTSSSASWAAHFLMYVQRLDVMPQQHGKLLEHTMQMHVLKCAMRSAGTPFGDILPLDQLRSLAHIIPHFGHVADSCLTAENSAHFAQTFFLNKYIDKDFYYAISNSEP